MIKFLGKEEVATVHTLHSLVEYYIYWQAQKPLQREEKRDLTFPTQALFIWCHPTHLCVMGRIVTILQMAIPRFKEVR